MAEKKTKNEKKLMEKKEKKADDAKLKEKQQKQWLKEKEAAEKLRLMTIVAAQKMFQNASKKTKKIAV